MNLVWFVVGGCLGIMLASAGLAWAFIKERREWQKHFNAKDLEYAYLVGFKDGKRWGYGDIWQGK